MTQSALAAAAGTTQSAVSRWESRADVPRIDRLAGLLTTCGVEADLVCRGHDDVDRAQIRAHLALSPRQRVEALRNTAALRHRARAARTRAVRS